MLLVVAQLVAIYLAVTFPVIVGARLIAGADGARAAAGFFFRRAPTILITGTFWLLVDCLLFFFPQAASSSFVDTRVPLQEPIMPPQPPPPEDNSLHAKLDKAKREQMALVMRLTGGHVDEETLTRALELGLIDQIAVRTEHAVSNGIGNGDNHNNDSRVVGLSFVVRTQHVFVERAMEKESETESA